VNTPTQPDPSAWRRWKALNAIFSRSGISMARIARIACVDLGRLRRGVRGDEDIDEPEFERILDAFCRHFEKVADVFDDHADILRMRVVVMLDRPSLLSRKLKRLPAEKLALN
jgi:hypothetical protein